MRREACVGPSRDLPGIFPIRQPVCEVAHWTVLHATQSGDRGRPMKRVPEFESTLARAYRHTLEYVSRLDSSPIAASASLDELRARLGKPLNTDGIGAEQVIDELAADVQAGLTGSTSGRFFAWVMGGSMPAPMAADWLVSAWDQNAASYTAGPAMSVIEEVCGDWLKDLLGLPPSASFAFTTGSQMAHVTALAAARNQVLAQKGWDVERAGLFGAPRIRLISSDQHHGSIYRAARLLGFGTDAIHALPANDKGTLEIGSLERALQTHSEDANIVLLQAGDINIGAFDPFCDLVPVARKHGAWVHVDGAFGLWVNACPKYRHLLSGVQLADSWVTDGHKWLNVPYDCGYAFVAHPRAHHEAMSQLASYVSGHEGARDQRDWNPEWSRRARAVPTYAAIRQLGRSGIETLIDGNCRSAHRLVSMISALPGAQLMWEPVINQGLVRFLDPKADATDDDHDKRTDEIALAVAHSGEALFSNTTWRGMRCMRVSVCNWQTEDVDVSRAVDAVRDALRSHT
jgi:glutamate/tyrosine decarboxylase-like PLP-dependent enzyme